MVFLQPVVMNDAHAADRSPAAEVRVVDRQAFEQPVWHGWQVGTGLMLAQQGLDQRSPFGNNAPTSNQLTPTPRMVNPNPTDNSGAGQVSDPMSTTKIPPAQGQPDAGPPPPSSVNSATPGEPSPASPTPGATGATAPGTAAGTPAPIRTTPMPTTTPSTPTQGTTPGSGAGATPPTIPDTQSVPPQPIQQPSSSTFPGAATGTSPPR